MSTVDNSNQIEQQSATTGNPHEFDKYEKEFQVLDETDLKDDEDDEAGAAAEEADESSSEVSDSDDSDDDDGIESVALDKTITPMATPTPHDNSTHKKKKKEPVMLAETASKK